MTESLDDLVQPADADGRPTDLGCGRIDAADADIIEERQRCCHCLLHGPDGKTDERRRPENAARVLDRHVVLPNMNAVRLRLKRDIDPVIDEQRHAERAEDCLQAPRFIDHGGGVAHFVAQLNEGSAARRDRPREVETIVPASIFRVQDHVEAQIELFHRQRVRSKLDRQPILGGFMGNGVAAGEHVIAHMGKDQALRSDRRQFLHQ
jgi:hypothetical protein